MATVAPNDVEMKSGLGRQDPIDRKQAHGQRVEDEACGGEQNSRSRRRTRQEQCKHAPADRARCRRAG